VSEPHNHFSPNYYPVSGRGRCIIGAALKKPTQA
jgi:hypothetical protein